MARTAKRNIISIRPTAKDLASIDTLAEKLGISMTSVIRYALHRAVEDEGIQKQAEKRQRQIESTLEVSL